MPRFGFKTYACDLFSRLNYSSAEILHRARYLDPGHSFRIPEPLLHLDNLSLMAR